MNAPHIAAPCLRADLALVEREMVLRFARPVAVPEFPVVTLRGLLGYALKEYLAPDHDTPPEDSLFWLLFKPGERRPHPVLLDCAPGAGAATALRIALRGFGRHGEAFLDTCVEALERCGPRGFGVDRVPYTLDPGATVRPPAPWDPAWRPSAAGRGTLELVTPAQLTWRNAPVDEESPLLHVIGWAAVRRLRGLAEAWGGEVAADPEAVDAVLEAGRMTRTALDRVRAERTSSMDGDSIAIGGIRGRIEFEGPPELLRIFAIAARVGIGKKVFVGNGRVRLVPPSEGYP